MDVKLPKLGEGADSGVVVKILIQEGDTVEKDQALIEMENEKAVAPIPSTAAGKVTKIHVREGDTLSAGDRIASLSEGEGGKKTKSKKGPDDRWPAARRERRDAADKKAGGNGSGEKAAAPSVRKIVRRLGIDLSRVQGTARGGRVQWEDLRDYVAWLQGEMFGEEGAESEWKRPEAPAQPEIDFSKWGEVGTEKLSATRQSIGRKMLRSWTAIPHVTQFAEADLTDLMKLKKKYDPAFEKKKARLTLTGFFLKALVPVLEKHPEFNASLSASGEEIVFKKYFHVSVAVDTEQGLLAPVIRDVNKKSLLGLSKELAEIAEKARARRISSEEMQGGCFTLSNLGGIGGAHFTPIVNAPEVAILGVGRGAWLPRLVGKKKIAPRLIAPLALSYDHRLIDGAAGARFIVELVEMLENFPEKLLKSKE